MRCWAHSSNLYQAVIANHGLEEEQGHMLARTSLEAGVQCFVWSTLPSTKKFSNGELDVFVYECMTCRALASLEAKSASQA